MNRIKVFLDQVGSAGSRTLEDVFATNVWVTTSGQFTLEPFKSMIGTVDVSRIMFSVDYPIANNTDGVEFMEELKASGLVSSEELEMIAHGNAEALLGIKLSP